MKSHAEGMILKSLICSLVFIFGSYIRYKHYARWYRPHQAKEYEEYLEALEKEKRYRKERGVY